MQKPHPLNVQKLNDADKAGLTKHRNKSEVFKDFDHKWPVHKLFEQMINEYKKTPDEFWADAKEKGKQIAKYGERTQQISKIGHKSLNDRLIQTSLKFEMAKPVVEAFYMDFVKDCMKLVQDITIDFK